MKGLDLLTPEIFSRLYDYLRSEWPEIKTDTEIILGWSEIHHGLTVTVIIRGEKLYLVIPEYQIPIKPSAIQIADLITGNGEFRQYLLAQERRLVREAGETPLTFRRKNPFGY